MDSEHAVECCVAFMVISGKSVERSPNDCMKIGCAWAPQVNEDGTVVKWHHDRFSWDDGCTWVRAYQFTHGPLKSCEKSRAAYDAAMCWYADSKYMDERSGKYKGWPFKKTSPSVNDTE